MTLKPFFQKAADEIAERERASLLLSRQQQFEKGYLTVEDLDDEELRAGKCRDQSGAIPRNPRKTEPVPRDLYDEMVAEHERRFNHRLRENLDTMVDVIVEVATDETVEPRDRFEAAKYVVERVAGKTPDRVQVAVAKAPWEEVLHGIAKLTREQSRALREGTIDAEAVEIVDEEQPQSEPEPAPVPEPTCPPISHSYPRAPDAPDWHHPVQTSSTMVVDPVASAHQSVGPQTSPLSQNPNLVEDTKVGKHESGSAASNPESGSAGTNVDGVGVGGRGECSTLFVPPNLQSNTPEIATDPAKQNLASLSNALAAASDLAERRKAARDRIRAARKKRAALRNQGTDAFRKVAEGRPITYTEVPTDAAADADADIQVQFGLAPDSPLF